MTFANVVNKARYNQNHRIIINVIQPKFMIYLKFHQKYILLGLINKKLSNQRIELFKIIETMNKFKQAFKLKLSSIMKIHSVIFIAQLKSITSSSDSYNRNFVFDSSIVLNEHANIDVFFYEIERLIDKRIIKNKTHYLIKWKNCEHQHNVWYFIDNLQNVVDFITKYKTTAFRRFIKRRIRLSIFTVRVLRRRIATFTAIQASQKQKIQMRIFIRSIRRE